MSNFPIFEVAGSALSAQSVRLNTIASNLANSETVSGNPSDVYRPLDPVFRSTAVAGGDGLQGVGIADVVQRSGEPLQRYEPGHPLADANGYVYAPDIDPVAQMVDMISASRSYQAGVEVMNTAKDLALATLNFGR
jgi:flagellar basal-body rod protein FlgC